MTKDKEELNKYWKKAVDAIISECKSIKTAAFITLGDPSIYSTYSYMVDQLKQSPAIDLRTVPGITAFSASAAALNLSLVEADEKLALLPASDLKAVENAIDNFETIVLYKVARHVGEISELLYRKNLLEKSFLISRVSTKEESIENLKNVSAENNGYFSTLIVKKGNK